MEEAVVVVAVEGIVAAVDIVVEDTVFIALRNRVADDPFLCEVFSEKFFYFKEGI